MVYCISKDQWNSSQVSYKYGGFLSEYKQKIRNSSGMKINLYQILQGEQEITFS